MILAAAIAIVALSVWKRVPPELALTLVWTALAGLVVIGNCLLPLPHRYLLELSAGLALLLAALLSLAPRRLICIVIAIGVVFSFRFVTHAWKFEPPPGDPSSMPAYQTASVAEGSRRQRSGSRIRRTRQHTRPLDRCRTGRRTRASRAQLPDAGG